LGRMNSPSHVLPIGYEDREFQGRVPA